MARSVNISELLESDRWVSFIESTASGLQLELLIISQDDNLTIKIPKKCPFCQKVVENFNNKDLKSILMNPNQELSLDNGLTVFASPLQNGLVMLAWECLCLREKVYPLLVNRGRVAAKLLNSFQKALNEGFECGQRTVELSTLRQLNHFVLSLCQGEGNALANTFDLILSAIIILLNPIGSWLEFADPELPSLIIKGDEDVVRAALLKPALNTVIVEVNLGNSQGKLGVLQPRDPDQALVLLPLMAQECIIAIEIDKLFRLLNKQLNQVLGAVSSAVLLIDQRKTITFANRRAEALLKKRDTELIGSEISFLKGPWLSYLRSDTSSSIRGEMECFTTDNEPESRCWVDWQMSPLLEGSIVLGWLLLLDDRTDYYRWQDAVRKAERFATTAAMVGALAHELRNPISAAKGLLQLMGRKRDPEQTRNYTNLVLRELDRVTGLLNEFLLLGKPSAPNHEPLDLGTFLQELLPLLEGEANGTEVEVFLKIESEVSPIIADPGQLTQVMLNLVRNAIQAIVQAGRVTIELRESNGFVYVDVSDNGPGISPEVLNNLFQPFFSTKERGTGLGLPIVQAIIHNHGGKIIPFNNSDGGAVFSLSFPAAEKGREGIVDVLIIANNKIFAYPLERALISLGINVITFNNIEKAMSEVNQSSPAVVILEVTDVQKSQELISKYRAQWPKVKILMLTQSLLSSIHTDRQQNGDGSANLEFVTFEYPVDLTRVVSTTRRILGR